MTEREQLFRTEVLLHRSDRKYGTAVLRQRPMAGVVVLLSVLLVAAAILLLAFTRYKESATTRGVLVSSGGAHRVVAPVAAIVQHIAVTRGETVHEGQVLATLERATFDRHGDNVNRSELAELHAQHELLKAQHDLQSRHYRAKRQQLVEVIADLEQGLMLIDAEQALLQQQLQLTASKLTGLKELARARAISRAQLEQGQLDHLGFELRLQALAQRRHTNLSQGRSQQAMLDNLAMEQAQVQLHMEQQQQQLQATINRHRNEMQMTVVAAAAGRVATIAVDPGQNVLAQQPLFYIEAESAPLAAVLFVPSRVVGKLYPGQELLLSYDAFDYQHYGRYQATITSIEHASLDPREHLLPIPGIQEPVFRIHAEPAQAWVEGPDVYRLQSGMQFSADIVLEELSLLEFIFKPVLRLRARMT